MSRRRRLSPEDEALWQRIARTTNPMQKPRIAKAPPKQIDKPPAAPEPGFTPPKFRIGEKSVATETRIPPPTTPVRMDRKAYSKLKRGKSAPEARIDLHGMTAATAHTALTAFLLRAFGDGKRLVLVITGKGKPSETGPTGILRREVPHWLDQPPLRQIVLQTTPAHQRHGGSGALYVYLRRG